MGKKKVRTVKNGGDEGLAQMAYDEGACENPWPPPDWDRICPILKRARQMADDATLDQTQIDGILAEIRPYVHPEEPCTFEGFRKKLLKLAKKSEKKQAKQAKRDAAAAPSSQSRPTVTAGDGCCRREVEPSNVA